MGLQRSVLLPLLLLLCSDPLPAIAASGWRTEHRRPAAVGSPLPRGGPPHFIMQLYRSFGASPRPAGGFSPRTTADSILSLTASGCHQAGEKWSITFDLSSISASNLVQLAELWIRLPAFSASKRASVDLHHSRKRSCSGSGESCRDERLLLGSLRGSPRTTASSWKVYNVTSLLKYWLYQGDVERISEASGEPEADSGSGEDSEALFRNLGKAPGINHPTAERVMMVIFLKDNQPQGDACSLIHTVENSKYVTKDGVKGDGQSRRHKRNRLERVRPADTAAPSAPPPAETGQRPMCRKVDMWVDFDHIGWDEWIVHPKRYNAYRCEGDCPSPLDDSFHPTNHAYMQSLLRHHHPERVSCPSCVPTRLSPLSMLYYESDDLALRHHEDMIVEECGCH